MKYIIFSSTDSIEVTNSLEELNKSHDIISIQFTTNQTQSEFGQVVYTTFSVLVQYKLKD